VSARFSAQALANTETSLGIRDVFDTKPPFEANAKLSGPYGMYSYFGDPRLASYYLSVRRNF